MCTCVCFSLSVFSFFFYLGGGEYFFLLKDNQPDPLMRCLTYTYNLYIKIKQNPASVILYLTAHFFLFFSMHFMCRSNILRPLKGREPEGMWNLLSIVRELFSRGDMNAANLLVILTKECLANDQVLIWWYDSRSQASGNSPSHSYGNNYRGNTNTASTEATKHACAGFCDELVALWRLAALNPKLSNDEREEMKMQLQEWHQKTVDKGQTGNGQLL